METPEHQAQESVIANGAAEASTSSPASPPPVLAPTSSDLSRTAEQGKDASPTPHTATSSTVAPPKKFTAVNVNKRFMEQNSPTPGASQIPSSSASHKIASTTVKSPPPPATSHSRLVSTKLTKLPPSSAGSGSGWTRPSSTVPSLAPSPVSGSMSSAPPPLPAPVTLGPPQLPHAGKVIHPPPRGAIQVPSTSRPESAHGSNKPAWRNVKPGGSATGPVPPLGVQNEFPTAAEAGRLNGVPEKKQSPQVPATPLSATTEADTFRGVHLDPNAHHWDEMEEDNDDFLGGVIEFGDGRQYQIQPVDVPQTTQDSSSTSVPAPETSSPDPQSPSAPSGINKDDRFSDDDFDRSWPRSAALSSNIRPRVGPPAGASTSSSSSLSPQEASRRLFNERSNRLEPWSSNNLGSPPDGRLSRDAPSHSNVQLLQKQGLDRPREVRRDTGSSQGTEDRRWDRGRRASNATTTYSAPSGGRDSSRESLRQLPPHLVSVPKSLPPLHTQLPNTQPPSSRHSSTRAPWRQGRSPDQSPCHGAISPLTYCQPPDLELARKAAMHTAAERAKIRRQQEEEERESARERARKKAAELEEKMKLTEKTESQAPSRAQEPQPEPPSPQGPTESSPDRQSLVPPLKQSSQDSEDGLTASTTSARSQRGSQSTNQPPSASNTATSWRMNAAPLSSTSSWRSSHSPVIPSVTFPSASQVLGVQWLNPSNDESLEEVEFTDLGKFVGVEPDPEETLVSPLQQGDIPLEDGHPQPTRSRRDPEPSWRRKASLTSADEQPFVVPNVVPEAASESHASKDTDAVPVSPSVHTSIYTGSPVKPLAEGSLPNQTLAVPSSLPTQRSPRATSYREDLISTFDDTMSRIKGAMQTKPQRSTAGTEHYTDRPVTNSATHSAEQPRFGRGVPPPRRHSPRVPEPDEPFTTRTELDDDTQRGQPNRVRLPSLSRALDPLSKRELANQKRSVQPLRWEVLSWDPPVGGMSPSDYSIDGLLFRKPPVFKGRPRYVVQLPPSGAYLVKRSSPTVAKVHLPAKPLVSKPVVSTGAFGRPRVADEHSSWRRTLPSIPDQVESAPSSEGLVTRSGSSPPDTEKPSDVTPGVEAESTLPAQWPAKSRAEPKMPAGAGVAFYRESTSCPSVSFTVSSELEDVRQPETPETPLLTEEPAPVSQPSSDPKGEEIDGSSTLLTPPEKAESKSSDGSVSTSTLSDDVRLKLGNGQFDTPLTPPSSTGWTKSLVKESPVRQPDPEQLKLLWSQTSEKADVPGVNSLEGIADDLPSVPFTFQEVKSEDGETPPPTGSNGPGPSRMSLHDVTRAFQQVPPPPAGPITGKASPQSLAVQSTTSGSVRHLAFTPHAAYPAYPSPILSHSPAPTLLYPHPMAPNHMMGGHSAQYAPQPMWIPMPPGGQTPGGGMRPLPSPYPAHASYMPYPSPGAYAAAASQTGPPGPPPNGAQNRSRPPAGGPVTGLSPNLSHSRAPATVPMYHQGSPVLVHPQVMHVQPPPSYPGPMPPGGRGVPMQAPHPTAASHAGGYTPTTHSPYMRPPWHPAVN
ncbi:hypothetical protein BC827DRAFT_1265765 [Russula dissimulans]|nr:hypothetical protein BC827DRAFT_1265765 [Russula dissimulans]